jgi:hypothetical protein
MLGAVKTLHLDLSERYTPEIQEKIFADYLIKSKRRPIFDYIVGKEGASLHAAQKAASQEWASIDDPDTPGRPYGDYAKHGNQSTTRAASVADALNAMRQAYANSIRRGATEDDAWRRVTGQSIGAREKRPDRQAPGTGGVANDDEAKLSTSSLEGIQQSLRSLGYEGLHERMLVEDGYLGPNTTHAIKSFQHAHHLHVDGIAGPRTLAALEEAKRYPLLSEATNPHHRMYQQVLHGIRALPRDQQPMGRQLENAAVALTIAAHGSGLHQIDHVVIGSNGVNLFAVQGPMHDPAHRRVHVELAHAVVHAPDHRSMTAAQPAPQHLHAQAVAQQQGASRAPVTAGP